MNHVKNIDAIANALLYEGFLLYPYRHSSVKNQHRWSFGVLFPRPFCDSQGERAFAQTECLMEGRAFSVKIRWLQWVQGSATEQEFVTDLTVAEVEQEAREYYFSREETNGVLAVSAAKLQGPTVKITVRIENLARYEGSDRDEALAHSFISLHAILQAQDGRFFSLIDPPEYLAKETARCENIGLWPVLAGRDDSQMLSAPVILYDHPQVAPQSPGDLFDGTEIDEILSLRIRTLTESEKAEVRTADPRVGRLLERTDALTREELFNLHASMRTGAEHLFREGDRVRLCPRRRADIMDIALKGKLATVLSVERDFENSIHVCVTVDDDPGKDLGMEGKPGHRFFFGVEELEPA